MCTGNSTSWTSHDLCPNGVCHDLICPTREEVSWIFLMKTSSESISEDRMTHIHTHTYACRETVTPPKKKSRAKMHTRNGAQTKLLRIRPLLQGLRPNPLCLWIVGDTPSGGRPFQPALSRRLVRSESYCFCILLTRMQNAAVALPGNARGHKN